MKAASGPLLALLNSGDDFVMADLYTITLSGGGVVRWTNADKDIGWGGNTFVSGPAINRTGISETVGLATSTLELTIIGDDDDTLNGVPVVSFIAKQGFYGATVKLECAFMADWNSAVTGTLIRFAGKVTSADDVHGNEAHITVSSWTILLDQMMPPDLYQATCLHTLYDAGCGLNKASFATAATATSGSSITVVNTGTALTANDFALGQIVFTSGANNGVRRGVKSNTTGALTMTSPLPVAPAAGDAFTIYKGCDRTRGTCSSKFSNLANYKGFDFVPSPEVAI